GTADGGTGEIFVLPVGFRPDHTYLFDVISGGSQGRVDINSAGAVSMAAGSSNISFNEVSFYVGGGTGVGTASIQPYVSNSTPTAGTVSVASNVVMTGGSFDSDTLISSSPAGLVINSVTADSNAQLTVSVTPGATPTLYTLTASNGSADHFGGTYTYDAVAAGGGGIPGPVTFVETNTGDGDFTDILMTKPSGVVSSVDMIALIVEGRGNPTYNTPATWDAFADINGDDNHIRVFTKIADGSEAATLTLTSDTATIKHGWYLRIPNATAIDVQGAAQIQLGSISLTVAGITTTIDNTLAIYVQTLRDNRSLPFSVTAGAGWSESSQGGIVNPFPGNSATFGTKEMAVAGATGSLTIDNARGSPNASVVFSVR
ncbi:MAG: hypothetical protein KAG66_16895, partial [Methylococcales bacterium]|nr:hypothetical protein [Methylococcales bacterium]